MLAALMLSVLGVDDEVVAADYHLNASAVERLVAWLNLTRPDLSEEMSRQPKALLSCPQGRCTGSCRPSRHGTARSRAT